ncbi:MAG: FHA domain-containing protein [Actinomycetota bacterium]
MNAHFEVLQGIETKLFTLVGQKLTLGKSADNDICVNDPAMSHLHAALEHYGSGWAIKDLGSKNGTHVNGEAIVTERRLRAGDEVRIGNTILIFRTDSVANATATQGVEPPPDLTRREREVLIALCRPVMSGSMFTRPATIKEIAAELVVTDNAIKQHLGRLYDKFNIFPDSADPRTLQLANEAIRRGAVNLGDLR